METRELEPVKQLENRKTPSRSKGSLRKKKREKKESSRMFFFYIFDSLTWTPYLHFHGEIKKVVF